MRRQFMAIGLGAFALLLFALISATLAAPASRPTLDTEPNDDFGSAEVISVPGYATGSVSETDLLDYYEITTEIGRQYEATLSIMYSTGGMNMLMNLYDASQDSLGTDEDTLEWTAYTTTHYIRIDALLATTTTFQTGDYRLDVARLAIAPTYTPSSTSPTGDSYEPNDSFGTAADMPVNMPTTLSLTFHTTNDEEAGSSSRPRTTSGTRSRPAI